MASITNRLLCLRFNLHSYLRPYPCPIHHHFSSSSEPPPTTSGTEADSETQSSFSSYFKDMKSSLQKERNSPQSPPIPISFPNPTPPEPPSSEFCRLSAAPPPSSSDTSGQPVTLQEQYKRNVTEGSNFSAATPLGLVARGKAILSYKEVREVLQDLDSRKKKKFVEMLETLRPENKEGKWLSLPELKEDLVKPRKIKEADGGKEFGSPIQGLDEESSEIKFERGVGKEERK